MNISTSSKGVRRRCGPLHLYGYAETANDYTAILVGIQEDHSDKAHAYLSEFNPVRFARFAIKVSRYGHESSNTVNGQLCDQRENPTLKLLEEIWDRQMYIIAARQHVANAPYLFVPRAVSFLLDAQQASWSYWVIFQTKDAELIIAKVISSVSLETRQSSSALFPIIARGNNY